MSKLVKTYLDEWIDEHGFLNGIYVPWLQAKWYGRDIGPNTLHGFDCEFNEGFVRKTFYNCKAIGFQMAKIWINEGFEGIEFDEKGSVIGPNPLFMKNLERLLQIANEVELPISICLVNHNESAFEGEKLEYDKYNRFMQIEAETEKYVTNYINPIVILGKKYGVTLFDLFAEPEAEGGLWGVSRSISWEAMTKFINRIGKAVKDIDPRFATTVSSGSSYNTILAGCYSDIEVDYYGADIYTNSGQFANTMDMMLEKPFMLGEYGPNDFRNAPDSVQIQSLKNFFNSCDNYRAAGGFYWCYGWAGGGGEMHIVNLQGELRETAAFLRFYEIDRESKRTGIVSRDVPCLAVTDSTEDIQWFGSRGAEEYILEFESDNGWQEVETVKAEDYEDFPKIVHASHHDSPEKANYRVTAVFADGEKITSNELMLEKKVTY